ncbi:hypothetical protein [Paraburkholderia aromaticivorans]|uniref:hypothetical protein n=1 Tax=Paraburkholderia aromaticivorans TaxID=2026199 RepID=UPI0038B6DF54
MSSSKDDDLTTSKREELVAQHLRAPGIFSIEDAPDELLEEADTEADKILGKGNDN